MTYMQKLNQARDQAERFKKEARNYLRVNIELSEQIEKLTEENKRLKTQNEELMVPSW